MRKTMAAMALSFLMAMGGGEAFAKSNGKGASSSSAAASQPSGQQGANGQGPVGFAEEEIQTGPFTIERVDKQNRNMVVRGPDGTKSTVNIPSGTPGFDSLKSGDQVQFDYFEAAVVGPGSSRATGSAQTPASPGMANPASGSNASANGSGRTVRNIRKVGHNGDTQPSGNPATPGNPGHTGTNGTGQEHR
jgi:hypothetical protein